jgi:hypothetical protein
MILMKDLKCQQRGDINLIQSGCAKVRVRRMWNDWRVAEVDYEKIRNIHWDRFSGGVSIPAPQYFIHGYIWCDDYEGELAHSCRHGKGPHHIKICITKTDNEPTVFAKIEKQAGPKLRYVKL